MHAYYNDATHSITKLFCETKIPICMQKIFKIFEILLFCLIQVPEMRKYLDFPEKTCNPKFESCLRFNIEVQKMRSMFIAF